MRTDMADIRRSGGLWPHWRAGRLLRVGFAVQSCILTGLCVAGALAASAKDHTLLMSGRNVGLLQHPTIWAFFGLQLALPLSIKRSLTHLFENRERIDRMAGAKDAYIKQIVQPIRQFLRLHSTPGRVIGALAYGAGLAAFVWNTYQNQLPGVIVPWDFWDSSNHLWGFWFTRVYKLYLFCWLLPYISLVHVAILMAVLKAVRQARLLGTVELQPFAADGVGGLGFIPPLVSSPVIVTLLLSTIAVAAAIAVHRALDVTPTMGLAILLGSALGAYIVPIVFLRRDIVELKRTTLEMLWTLQENQYAQIAHGAGADPTAFARANEALEYFDKVRRRVDGIPNYPHISRIFKTLGIAITPSLISTGLSLYDHLTPVLPHFLRKP